MGKQKSTWKGTERTHARLFGAKGRTGPTGLDMPDWHTPYVAGESKHMQEIPAWLREVVQQSIDNEHRLAGQSGMEPYYRVPIAVLHMSGTPFDQDIVLVRSDIFREAARRWLWWGE